MNDSYEQVCYLKKYNLNEIHLRTSEIQQENLSQLTLVPCHYCFQN